MDEGLRTEVAINQGLEMQQFRGNIGWWRRGRLLFWMLLFFSVVFCRNLQCRHGQQVLFILYCVILLELPDACFDGFFSVADHGFLAAVNGQRVGASCNVYTY